MYFKVLINLILPFVILNIIDTDWLILVKLSTNVSVHFVFDTISNAHGILCQLFHHSQQLYPAIVELSRIIHL